MFHSITRHKVLEYSKRLSTQIIHNCDISRLFEKTADYQTLILQHFQAKNMPRYQKKKIRAAMVQTQVPTGFNMKRRTSSTITQDEAILLGGYSVFVNIALSG